MAQGFRWKAAVASAAVCIAITSFALALGQTAPQNGGQRGVLPMISVASLRIPKKAWKHYEKALAAATNNRQEEYIREAALALEIAPDFAEVYLLRAAHSLVEQDWQQVIDNALVAQRIQPQIGWARILLASAYNGLHRYNDARLLLDSLQGAEAETWQAKYEMARAAIGLGDVQAALRYSELELKVAPPECLEAHLLRGNALQMAHRWREAITQLDLYLSSNKPQVHRVEVLVAAEKARKAAAAAESSTQLASR